MTSTNRSAELQPKDDNDLKALTGVEGLDDVLVPALRGAVESGTGLRTLYVIEHLDDPRSFARLSLTSTHGGEDQRDPAMKMRISGAGATTAGP